LPDVWGTGCVNGIRARGGFEIEKMSWKDGVINQLIIKSTLGGNCRIRSYWPLAMVNGAKLKPAEGENSNLFYQIPGIKKPLISDKAKLNEVDLRPVYLYDVSTKPGQVIVLIQRTEKS
jgi:alpha-L-fucosidase 2